MLVLSRKAGEDVLIGHDIMVTVIAVKGQRAKLAFTAPDEVVIRRAELVDANDRLGCAVEESESVTIKPK